MTGTGAAPAIEAVDLSKRFGSVVALEGIRLRLEEGESLVLFGPNGAGKTTLIRVLTLNLRAGGGQFSISGLDPRRDDVGIRARIGVISHQSYLYDDLSARHNLEFYSALHGVANPRARAVELLEMVGLVHRAEDPVRTLSRGMQQRVSLARALVHDPPIVFLDEPFTGLDPHAADMLRSMLMSLREQRRTVVLVTHNLRQGLELAERWAVLARGRIVESGESASTDLASFETAYFSRMAAPRRRRAR